MSFVVFFFYKITFSESFLRNTISVKQFGSRSGPTFCWVWSGSKLLNFEYNFGICFCSVFSVKSVTFCVVETVMFV